MTDNRPVPSETLPLKTPLPMRAQVLLFATVRMIININTRMVYPFLNTLRGLGVDLSAISLV